MIFTNEFNENINDIIWLFFLTLHHFLIIDYDLSQLIGETMNRIAFDENDVNNNIEYFFKKILSKRIYSIHCIYHFVNNLIWFILSIFIQCFIWNFWIFLLIWLNYFLFENPCIFQFKKGKNFWMVKIKTKKFQFLPLNNTIFV